MYKELNFAAKVWLKYTNRKKYKEYKWAKNNYKDTAFERFIVANKKLSNHSLIEEFAANKTELNFNHSGNAGDVIYALPTLKEVHETTGVKINLYLRLDQPLMIDKKYSHPLGNVMLNKKMADMLKPLIESQEYINHCDISVDQPIHIDLDYLRAGFIPMDKGNIARWCGYITGVNPKLWQNWLTIEPDNSYNDSIVVARSERYRNRTISHAFLSKYDNVVFIGVESEYNDIVKTIPNIKWVKVDDFLQMARIIAGCKLFIGNQSFPYSVAEALKVPRILEVTFNVINVVPEGENGHDFLFQDHFEDLVERLATNKRN